MPGGTPCLFNTFHVTDSETFSSAGMHYVLPSHDVMADMIELMVEGHRLDAMVLVDSGDEVMPGMVMAAARLDLPMIMISTTEGSTSTCPRARSHGVGAAISRRLHARGYLKFSAEHVAPASEGAVMPRFYGWDR